jgi:hypothetical protein
MNCDPFTTSRRYRQFGAARTYIRPISNPTVGMSIECVRRSTNPRQAFRSAGQRDSRCCKQTRGSGRMAAGGTEIAMAGIDSALTVRGVLTCAPGRRMLTATGQPRPHIVWWESEHESHPAAVDARHRPHQRDAILCAVRFKLFAEFWVSVLRRSSVPGAGVRLVGLWGSTRPRHEPGASPAWASSRVTSDRRARSEFGAHTRRRMPSFKAQWMGILSAGPSTWLGMATLRRSTGAARASRD